MTATRYPGTRVTDRAIVLQRVIPEGKATASGSPTSGAFVPTKGAFKPGGRGTRDNGGLSTSLTSQSPEDVFVQYVVTGRQSIGVWGVTVAECDDAGDVSDCELPVFDDGNHAGNPEHHATVWFPMPPESEMSDSALRRWHDRIAKELRDAAIKREPRYRAP